MADSKMLGRFTFVLHSHLPYVLSHGNWPHGMVWLNEAACETYIPLWRVFTSLKGRTNRVAITIGMSPVLVEQLSDPVFVEEMNVYLHQKIEAAKTDLQEFEQKGELNLAKTARYWIDWYTGIEKDFNGPLNQNIIGAFKDLQDEGTIEIITCGATHGYLPLLGTDEAVNAQVELAVQSYKRHFGRAPKGIWLPECAYRPGYHWVNPTEKDDEGFDRKGVEQFLQKHGLRYFIVDSHLLKGGKAVGTYLTRFEGLRDLWERSQDVEQQRNFDVAEEREPYRVYWVDGTMEKGEPVGILTRDPDTSLQVWSGEYGYPGDGNYLDFHKKHFPGGHRYWRVTSAKADLGDKEQYVVENIEQRLDENADHFVTLLRDTLRKSAVDPNQRQVVSPFDTELFGHWWYEGPGFLERVLWQIDNSGDIQPAHGSELIASTKEAPVVALPEGSWGEGGFHYIWLNENTEWSWPLIHECERLMTETVRNHADADGELKELMQQLGRELLLLESSDWQFLISTIAAKDYAELRLQHHYDDFKFLHGLVVKHAKGEELNRDEQERYSTISKRDTLFPDLDLNIWA
ncbi:DUF1957 domain-containing protein [bacterium]|nr:DUF1957 domain-containing protein [bacterium]